MVGQITGKMFDQSIEKDCVSDLSGPASCRIGPVRQVAGPESAAIQNLAAMHWCFDHLQLKRCVGDCIGLCHDLDVLDNCPIHLIVR